MSVSVDAVVVGGGLAGLSAAAALAESGRRVTLLEWRPYIGGRAYSYEHPAIGEVIDSQHVVLGCCSNILDLCRRAGISDWIRWYDELVFLEPSGRRSWLKPGRLKAPAHQTMSFLRAPMLSVRDKLGIAQGLARFLPGYPRDDGESFSHWLARTGQTERAVRHFWEPVVVGALNDTFDRCSVKYAGKVFHESFLRSAEAGRLGIPARPLTEFFEPVAELARRSGVEVRLRSGVSALRPDGDGWVLSVGKEETLRAGAVVLATDHRKALQLMSGLDGGEEMARGGEQFVSAPITTVHLWFDREVTELDHAVLLDTRIQWMFAEIADPAVGGVARELPGAGDQRLVRGAGAVARGDPAGRARGGDRVLSGDAGGAAPEEQCTQRGASDVFCYAGAGPVSAAAADAVAGTVCGGRLDEDGVALDDGGCGAQWAACGG